MNSHEIKPLGAARFLSVARSVCLSFLLLCSGVSAQQLRCVTINIWTGLDYNGNITMGEYEPAEVRERRFKILLDELKKLEPDVVALQEVNPIYGRSQILADELGYDCIYERTNAGLKIGRLGLPWNLNEGAVILAKKELHLQFVDVWNLADGFGFIGNVFSFHFTERRSALVGKVRVGNLDIYLVTLHLSSAVPDDSCARAVARQIASSKSRSEKEIRDIVGDFFDGASDRMISSEILLDQIHAHLAGKAFIILGDLNASPSEPESRKLIESGKLIDVADRAGIGGMPTWDPEKNMNVCYSVQTVDARGRPRENYDLLYAWNDGRPRRIDYIFLSEGWRPNDVVGAQFILDKPVDGLFASDHYGLLGTIDVSTLLRNASGSDEAISDSVDKKVEGFPILSYDTDTGFGYGAKAFFLNYLGAKESFDVTAFNSTKGERWYRLVFSKPDFELRQGKAYPLSFDVTIDYDKYLENNFYGVGSDSKEQDRETYTKEPLEILAVMSRGFSKEFVAQVGLKYRTVRNSYELGSLFSRSLPGINLGTSSALTLYGAARYDSRDSYINPSRGQVAQLEVESGGSWLTGNYSTSSATFAFQTYHVLCYPKTVFAARLQGQVVRGTDLPIHVFATVGGNRTLRGYPQDRFLDKAAGVLNAEVRFPIYRRLGGVLGLDAGKVFRSPASFSLSDWAVNSVMGLRFFMDTFIVRADIGFGKETTGFYLNFGHLF